MNKLIPFLILLPYSIFAQTAPPDEHLQSINNTNSFKSKSEQHFNHTPNDFNLKLHIERCNVWTAPAPYLPTIQNILVDDFLVNDDTEGGCTQHQVKVAMDAYGNYVSVWRDYRNGHADIFAQRFEANGNPIGSNFKVNDDNRYIWQYAPDIAMDEAGNFVIVWNGYHDGDYRIYGQRYNFSAEPMGTNFIINDDDPEQHNYKFAPTVAVNNNGQFIVAWNDSRENYFSNIYAQIFNEQGQPVGDNFRINSLTYKYQGASRAALNDNGLAALVWQDYRNNHYDIYGQLFNIYENFNIENEFRVNQDTTSKEQFYPDVAITQTGAFVVSWLDNRRYDSYYDVDIYIQHFDNKANPIEENIKVNDIDETVYRYDRPTVCINNNELLLVVWTDYRGSGNNLYGQYYSSNGQPVFSNYKFIEEFDYSQYDPAIALNNNNQHVVVWSSYTNQSNDLFIQRFSNMGVRQGRPQIINDDVASAPQYDPDITIAQENDRFLVTWVDERQSSYDEYIYAQFYNEQLQIEDINRQVSSDDAYVPSVDMNDQGESIIVWEEYYYQNHYNYGVFGQRYNTIGQQFFNIFQVDMDHSNNFDDVTPCAAINQSGKFVVLWKRLLDYPKSNLYALRFNEFIQAVGDTFRVNDSTNTMYPYRNTSKIAMDDHENIVVVWTDDDDGYYNLFKKRFSFDNDTLSSASKVIDEEGLLGRYGYGVDLAMNSSGRFIIVWEDQRNDTYEIYGQLFSEDGSPVGRNFRINDDAMGLYYHYDPSVAITEDGKIVVVWQDYRFNPHDPCIVAQRYDQYGNPLGPNFIVVDGRKWHVQVSPVVDANNSKIVFAWQDNRRSKGWDIYAKVVEWNWNGITSFEDISNKPSKYHLGQNYPNPFNTSTAINFTLPNTEHISIEIINNLGMVVDKLIDERRPAGTYTIHFNAEKYASGLYFYRLQTSNSAMIRKMLLIK